MAHRFLVIAETTGQVLRTADAVSARAGERTVCAKVFAETAVGEPLAWPRDWHARMLAGTSPEKTAWLGNPASWAEYRRELAALTGKTPLAVADYIGWPS